MEAVLVGAFMFLTGANLNNEPHWSFRDGCKAETVKSASGNYGYTSYDSCKALPRVYGSVEWKPVLSGKPTISS